jgi:hypothetical protein
MNVDPFFLCVGFFALGIAIRLKCLEIKQRREHEATMRKAKQDAFVRNLKQQVM